MLSASCYVQMGGMLQMHTLHCAGTFFFIPFLAPAGAWGIHETFRFTSVSLSRTVGRTPWMSDQLTARPLPIQDNTNVE
jgi:nitrate reductase alpha subunit